MLKEFHKYISNTLHLLYPENCSGCKHLLVEGEEVICTSCLSNLPKTKDWLFKGSQFYDRFNSLYNCSIASSFLYLSKRSNVEKLLYQLKYNGVYEVGITLGLLYGQSLLESPFFKPENYDFIVPVPLHKKRLRKRGYNQSLAIAEGLSKSLKIPVNNKMCTRNNNNSSQTSNNKIKRIFNVEQIFSASEDNEGLNSRILIVDDIITTGSTMDALCEELKDKKNIIDFGILCLAKK